MVKSNLKDVNIYNNATVSSRSGRLALTLVNIIRNLRKDKEEFTKSNENKSLLKKFVLFDYYKMMTLRSLRMNGEKSYLKIKNKRSRKNYWKKN
jgi:hypothetical protein